ncbi:heparan-alpha-glucosaminide N-acetyltransferase-like [Ptychodera flava]|uniref:heparan-alpha-glucosaminide N-acetyltransferase-like n=1 Tax=Ptychodera flava TaxID=63121 RepID=UPI00396A211F
MSSSPASDCTAGLSRPSYYSRSVDPGDRAVSDPAKLSNMTGSAMVPLYIRITEGACLAVLIALCSSLSAAVHGTSDADTPPLTIDTAYFKAESNAESYLIEVKWQTEECYQCILVPAGTFTDTDQTQILAMTQWPMNITAKFITHNASHECSLMYHFGEHGNYSLVVNVTMELDKNSTISCDVIVQKQPINSYIPIAVAFAIMVGLALITLVALYVYRTVKNKLGRYNILEDEETSHSRTTAVTVQAEEDGSKTDSARGEQKKRLRSLDTFRGISLTVMIFVNYGGGEYWFFDHSIWNGLTVADLVFPWFRWIMGVSMVLSFKVLRRNQVSNLQILYKILRRTVILFGLGLIVNGQGNHYMPEFRIPGVLQRFSITYLVVALMEFVFVKPATHNAGKWYSAIRDIVNYWAEWLIVLCLVAVQVILTFVLHVEDCPAPPGYLGPGGPLLFYKGNSLENCTGGAAGYVDRVIFGVQHIYTSPTCQDVYKTTMNYDPEGTLGCCTSIFMCFLGLQAGKILFTYETTIGKVKRWLAWALLTGAIAALLCKCSKNDGWIPINKNLWSVSFVLALSSMAFVLFTFCYIMVDVKGIWSGAPFRYPGMNSILVYVGHILLGDCFPFTWDTPATHGARLTVHLCGVAWWILISMYMYYIGFFVKI